MPYTAVYILNQRQSGSVIQRVQCCIQVVLLMCVFLLIHCSIPVYDLL